MHVALLRSVVSTYLPCRIVVSEIDEVLHEPGIDLTQCQTLFWRLQDCLGQTDRQLKVDYVHLTATRSPVYLSARKNRHGNNFSLPRRVPALHVYVCMLWTTSCLVNQHLTSVCPKLTRNVTCGVCANSKQMFPTATFIDGTRAARLSQSTHSLSKMVSPNFSN